MRSYSPWLSVFCAFSVLGACAPEPAAEGDGLPVLVSSAVRADASLQALAQGRLHLDPEGCLRIGENDGPLVIWPYDSRILRAADGRVQVIDGASGNAVHVGEAFAVSGASVDTAPTQLTQTMPSACAKGKFWLAGPVMNETDRLAMVARQDKLKTTGRPASANQP